MANQSATRQSWFESMNLLADLERHADLWIEVGAELDCTALTVRQILDLDQNSLIKLARPADENVDVVIGGSHAGRGEIIAQGQRIAVRITDLGEEH